MMMTYRLENSLNVQW